MKSYPSYKSTEVPWINKIPDDWIITNIGREFFLGRGRVISNIEILNNQGSYPVYSSQTENDGIMGKIDTFDFDGEYVTWTTDGANAGTVFYRNGQFNCTNVCGTIQPKNKKVPIFRISARIPALKPNNKLAIRANANRNIRPLPTGPIESKAAMPTPKNINKPVQARILKEIAGTTIMVNRAK